MSIKENGLWELPVKKSLINRNRQDRGLKVFDAELQGWAECLHRYDMFPDIDISQHQAINGAISKLYKSQTINFSKTNRRNNMILVDIESKPLKTWNGQSLHDILDKWSSERIDHNEYSNAVCSHPQIPVYLSGNQKGIISTFEFNQRLNQSTSLCNFYTTDLKLAGKKSTIEKIQFSSYGDKFGCINTEGSYFMFNF